jgi:hypothetical protein
LASGRTVYRIACRKLGDETRQGIRFTNTIGNAIGRLWLCYPWQNGYLQQIAANRFSIPQDDIAIPLQGFVLVPQLSSPRGRSFALSVSSRMIRRARGSLISR